MYRINTVKIMEIEGRIEYREVSKNGLSTQEIYMLAYGYKPKLIKQYRQFLSGNWTNWENC